MRPIRARLARGPFYGPCERVRFVVLLRALRVRLAVHFNAPVANAHVIRGHHIRLEAAFAPTLHTVKAPLMPGADDVFALERSLAERATCMVARTM